MTLQREQQELLEIFKALADEKRLAMLGLLNQAEYNVGDLAARLAISEPTVSHHLSRLRAAGLVTLRVQGSQHIYCLNRGGLRKLQARVAGIEQWQAEDPAQDDLAWVAALPFPLSDDDRRVFRDYTEAGRLIKIPSKQKNLLVILRWLASRFRPGVMYSEKEVNASIRQVFEDHATLRRDLVDFGFLRRERGGGKYWLTPEDEALQRAPQD